MKQDVLITRLSDHLIKVVTSTTIAKICRDLERRRNHCLRSRKLAVVINFGYFLVCCQIPYHSDVSERNLDTISDSLVIKHNFFAFRHHNHIKSVWMFLFREHLGEVNAFEYKFTFLAFDQSFDPLEVLSYFHFNRRIPFLLDWCICTW